MSEHVMELLNAYLDRELRGSHLQQVEAHLAECQVCREELEALARISSLVREIPAPEFMPVERFTAQVNLRLPLRRTGPPQSRLREAGWWMIPVGLLVAWVFVSTAFFVSDVLSAAGNMGLLASVSDWMTFDSASQADWSALLGQVGALSGERLGWAILTEAFTRTSLLQIILQASIALLYLSWMAIWWTRRQRQGPDPLLEG
jgi:anti-sigma factor RsiW